MGIRTMPGGRLMQCKDIPDALVIEGITVMRKGAALWAQRWDLRPWLEERVGEVPTNLFQAKMRNMINRGIIGGCPCPCRGDYHLVTDCMMGCCHQRGRGHG